MMSVDGIYAIGDIRNTFKQARSSLPHIPPTTASRPPPPLLSRAPPAHAHAHAFPLTRPNRHACAPHQVVVAAADGCIAAMDIDRYLKNRKKVRGLDPRMS